MRAVYSDTASHTPASYSGTRMSYTNPPHKKKADILRRAEALLGRERLARSLGVPPSMLAGWMRGDVTMPDGKLLELAAALVELAKPQQR